MSHVILSFNLLDDKLIHLREHPHLGGGMNLKKGGGMVMKNLGQKWWNASEKSQK
jgi:hypothetical protein